MEEYFSIGSRLDKLSYDVNHENEAKRKIIIIK